MVLLDLVLIFEEYFWVPSDDENDDGWLLQGKERGTGKEEGFETSLMKI